MRDVCVECGLLLVRCLGAWVCVGVGVLWGVGMLVGSASAIWGLGVVVSVVVLWPCVVRDGFHALY